MTLAMRPSLVNATPTGCPVGSRPHCANSPMHSPNGLRPIPNKTLTRLGQPGSGELQRRPGLEPHVLAAIISLRLCVVSSLPPLLSTIAIELAPPVVAGSSWFAINGGKVDTAQAILAGLSLLMLLVQLRLIPLYRRAPFGRGFWAFSFPFAAAVTYGVRWLAAEHVRGGTAVEHARQYPQRRVRGARGANCHRLDPWHVPAAGSDGRSDPRLSGSRARSLRHRWEVSSVTMSAADCGCLASATLCPAHIESASISPVVPAIGGAGS
jgi:hypothetical protein